MKDFLKANWFKIAIIILVVWFLIILSQFIPGNELNPFLR